MISRRAFNEIALGLGGVVAAGVAAGAGIEVDLREIAVGSSRIVICGRRAIVIRHRTRADIAMAKTLERGSLIDPQADSERTQRPEWIVLEARCTHLECRLLEGAGRYGGWLCPCHGSEFDPSGRVTRGPAEINLKIPKHRYIDAHTLVIDSCELR